MPLATILLVFALWSSGTAIATNSEPEHAGAAQRRAQCAAKLQDFLNSADITVKASVSAEGADLTKLRIVRPAAFRSQFRSLIRPFMNELDTLGFKSLVLCTVSVVCREIFIPIGTNAL